MDFGSVLNALRMGMACKRPGIGEGSSIRLSPTEAVILHVSAQENSDVWQPRHQDLLAVDWELA